MTTHTVCVIPACGEGRRMGGRAKATIPLSHGRTFLETICHTARTAGVTDIVVVTGGAFANQTRDEARTHNATVIDNPHPELDLAGSLSTAVRSLTEHSGHWTHLLLWPIDLPFVDATTVQQILTTAETDSGDVVIPTYNGRGGHPALISRPSWARFLDCHLAAEGPRTIMRTLVRTRIAVDDPGVVQDVDTAADLVAWGSPSI